MKRMGSGTKKPASANIFKRRKWGNEQTRKNELKIKGNGAIFKKPLCRLQNPNGKSRMNPWLSIRGLNNQLLSGDKNMKKRFAVVMAPLFPGLIGAVGVSVARVVLF